VGLLAIAWLGLLAKTGATIKLAFFSAVAGGTVLWSLRPRFDRFEPPGPELTRSVQPDLFGVIDDVARATHQATPRQVYAISDVNAWVSTRGGVLGIGGRRVMGLGIPLLHLLTVDQLKAVLAHEFGHYGGGDTKIGRLVYHTRLRLGRTLAAVDGKLVSVLFGLYGKLVMRVSTAVARHEEFAADRFAAQATSGQDLADSLQHLDKFGALFPLFYACNMVAVVEEGYWAPVGQGFAAFCSLPSLVNAKVTDGRADGEAQVDTTYDSHPSTAARVAALQALGLAAGRVRDTRIAGSLLREPSDLDFQVFKPRRKKSGALNPVEWADVTSRVLVPRWQRVVRENWHILKEVRIESPPAAPKDVIQLGRTAGGLKARLKNDDELMSEVLFAIACGAMTKLIGAGWTPDPSPGLTCEFVRGDQRVDPILRISAIGHGAAPLDEWAAFCATQGFSGPLA
jgi:Zn-dependent protease with chaperone function